jgi:release factor glutamine methyltransferase
VTPVTARPLQAALAEATARLESAGVPSARYDAEVLAAHSLGVDRRDLWRHAAPGEEFEGYVGRRAAREPLQHITGVAWFRHLTLQVGPGVFVPRPETEVVVDAVIAGLRDLVRPTVVDLGTGSGAIALAVATEVPGSRVHAVELDPAAHAWAARNCAGTAVDLRLGDMSTSFPDLDGTVDVVVSNPPYIPVDAVIRDPEVAAHDPAVSLWSGADGLDAMRVVERVAARLLRPGGLLVAEHADLQGGSAPAVFTRATGWRDVVDHRDLAGRDRYVTAVRTGDTMTMAEGTGG